MMRRDHHKTSLNYNQRHYLVKMMSIISLIFLLAYTILSPISQYVNAQGNGLGISLSTSSVNETEALVATLIDTGEDSNGPLSFTVPDGLTISGVVAGQENVEAVSNGNQTLQFNWTENSNKVVQVKLQAQKAGDYTATFSSSDSTVSASVTVVASKADEGEVNQPETVTEATEEESGDGDDDDDESDTSVSQDKEESETVATEEKEDAAETPSLFSSYSDFRWGWQDPDNPKPPSDDQYNHIDVFSTGSFTYKVDGEDITVPLEITKENIDNVKLYDKNGNLINITPKLQKSSTPGFEWEWRFGHGDYFFNKADNYTVEYTFYVDINDTPTKFVFEKTYNFDSPENKCPGDGWMRGLDIQITASDLSNHFTSGIIISKKVTSDDNSLNGTFNFKVLDSAGKQVGDIVPVTTENDGSGSSVISGLEPGTYTVVEVSPPASIGSSNLVSIKAGETNYIYSATDSVPYQTSVKVEKGNNKTVTFENVYTQEKPSITIKKTIVNHEATEDGQHIFKAGEKVEYQIEVTNTGNVDLTDLTLTDEIFKGANIEGLKGTALQIESEGDPKVDPSNFELKVGDPAITFKVVFTVPSELGGTVYTNVATVQNDVVNQSDDVTFKVEVLADLSVTKIADKTAKPGDTINYTITVENTGNVDLTGITLEDVFTKIEPQLNRTFKLGVREEIFKSSYLVPTKTLYNNVMLANILSQGEQDITDALTFGEGFDEAFALAIGESKEFTASYDVPEKTLPGTVYKNVITAKVGNEELGRDEVTTEVTNAPKLEVTKKADKETAKPGDTITYTITVTNKGNVDLEKVTLEDVLTETYNNVDIEKTNINLPGYNVEEGFALKMDETKTFTASYDVPEKTLPGTVYKNVITAKVGNEELGSGEVTTEVTNAPKLEVIKKADKETAKPGDTITYTITVENTGNFDLTGITLEDVFTKGEDTITNELTFGEGFDEPFALAIGESKEFTASYDVPEKTLPGTVYKNVITAKVGNEELGRDEVTTEVTNAPKLEVIKKADKETAKPGDTITYTITVENTGNLDLTGITLEDVFTKGEDTITNELTFGEGFDEPFALAIGESKEFTASYDVPEKTLPGTVYKNVIIAKVGNEELGRDEVTTEVTNAPKLEVTKKADKETAKPGDTITYTITVTNKGNVDLEKVTLEDVLTKTYNNVETKTNIDLPGYNAETGFSLKVDESKEFKMDYVVGYNDANNTIYENTVTAKTDGVAPQSAKATVTVKRIPVVPPSPSPNPSLNVEKTADKTEALVGETVTYTIVVTNTGNVALTNVHVKDDMIDLDTVIDQLYVNESVTLTGKYVVTADDIGGLENIATATVKVNGVTITDDDSVIVKVVNPSLSVEKTADKAQYLPGETVTYTINVTNDGNVDLKGITLNDVFSKNDSLADQQLTLEGYEGAFDLVVGETMSFTSTFVIPENDLADTTYKNVVVATTGDISEEGEVVIVVDPTYAFTIEKTADKNEATVGDTVTYTIVVTNTGNKALTNILVKDEMIGLDTIIDQLAANESKTFTGEYVVTADDIGELKNIATATVEVDGEQITHDASVIVNVFKVAGEVVDDTPPTNDNPQVGDTDTPPTNDKVDNWSQNPQTGDTTINTLLALFVFVLAGSGLYVYRRKYNGWFK